MCSHRVRKVWSCQVPVGWEKGKINGPLLGDWSSFVNLGVWGGGASSILLGGALPLSGWCPLGWEKALATVTTSPIFQGCVFYFPCIFFWGTICNFFKSMAFGFLLPLGMLVA